MGEDFEQFYAANIHALTVQVYAYVGDMDHAQDFAQEAFVRALPRWSTIREYDDPLGWLRRVAWNLANSRWRRLRTANAYLRKQRPAEVAPPSPDRVALSRALSALPEPQRRIVILHYLVDLPVQEIARQEGLAEGTVKSRLHRGRTALAEQLAGAREGNGNV